MEDARNVPIRRRGYYLIVAAIALIAVIITAVAVYSSDYYLPVPTGTQDNNYWGGYVVEAPEGTVTEVAGTWVVPSVSCGPGSASSVLVWIGIDGWGGAGSTVEQIGTRADCFGGEASYHAWYEFWSRQPDTVRLDNITIRPGDIVRAEVSGRAADKSFAMVITDLSTGESSHAHGNYSIARLATADWIVEAPISGQTRFNMSDFSSVKLFDNQFTAMGQTSPLNAISGNGTVHSTRLVYLCTDGTAKAVPSSMIVGDDSFTVHWRAGGNC